VILQIIKKQRNAILKMGKISAEAHFFSTSAE